MSQRFGKAPIAVYVDRTRAIGAAFRVASHPEFRFVTAAGTLTKRAPSGFPFR